MKKTTKVVAASIAGSTALFFGARAVISQLTKSIGKILMTDPYDQNLLELFSAAYRVGAQTIAETNLRAGTGDVINRPLGSPRQFLDFNGVAFSPAYLKTLPTPVNTKIATKTIIGKNCAKPLRLETPIIISGMAYGFGLSERAKWALAKGTSMAGTATNTGEGPWLQKERDLAKNLILQYNRGTWNKEPEIISQADMIEIQLGQGAIAGVGHKIANKDLTPKARNRLHLGANEPAIIESYHPELLQTNGLAKLVQRLRGISDGVPIGVKLSFNNTLETEIDIALRAGVDVLILEGTQAATKGSSPILQDEFGLPTIMGLSRAAHYLEKTGARSQVDLIIAGGLFTPGDFLKALALGADAVYIGSIALFALSHTQSLKAVPFEPPTQVVWDTGKYRDKFNWQQGAVSLAKFIKSCTLEMAEGVRALGKTDIHDVNRSDLVALDELTAQITGLTPAWIDINRMSPRTRDRIRPRRKRRLEDS